MDGLERGLVLLCAAYGVLVVFFVLEGSWLPAFIMVGTYTQAISVKRESP